MALSSITKGSAGAPTVGVSDRADYCIEEIESRLITWADDITNNDGVMASYEDIATDKNKAGPQKTITVGDTSIQIPDLSSATPPKLFKAGWETQFDNFVSKRADVNTTSYAIVDELIRIKGVLKTYRNLFWDEETAVNAEIARLETIRDQYQASADSYQAIADAHIAGGGSTGDTEYTDAIAARDHQLIDKATSQTYATDVKDDADLIFGEFNLDSNTGQTATCSNAVNGEFESILDTIHHGLVRACNRIGTKDVEAKYWVATVDRSDATTYVGLKYSDTPVALLNYMGAFRKMTMIKDTVSKLDATSFDITEFQSVSDELVGFDLGSGSTEFTDKDGVTQYAHYPQLNATPDAKEALLTTYYSTGVSPKYYNDKQDSLSSMAAQVSTAKAGVVATDDDLGVLALSDQTGDWDTDLDNLETARTQYSSWVYADAP